VGVGEAVEVSSWALDQHWALAAGRLGTGQPGGVITYCYYLLLCVITHAPQRTTHNMAHGTRQRTWAMAGQ
jgi:hypothetical protein